MDVERVDTVEDAAGTAAAEEPVTEVGTVRDEAGTEVSGSAEDVDDLDDLDDMDFMLDEIENRIAPLA